jgi:hypothetical protein
MMPELTTPTPRLHTAWLEAHREWGPGLHEDGFGLREADEIESAQGFFSWIERLNDQADAHARSRLYSLHVSLDH